CSRRLSVCSLPCRRCSHTTGSRPASAISRWRWKISPTNSSPRLSTTMSRTRSRRYGHLHGINEINVMPLVDLLLQMFIAVIIFFPVVEYGMNINLPKGTTDTIKREQTRTLSVDKAGNIYINDV